MDYRSEPIHPSPFGLDTELESKLKEMFIFIAAAVLTVANAFAARTFFQAKHSLKVDKISATILDDF